MNEQYLLMGDSPFTGIESYNQQWMEKSLELGYAMGTTDQKGLDAIRMESLNDTMIWAEANEKSPQFWIKTKKGKAKAGVEEFVTVDELGDAHSYLPGGLPADDPESVGRDFEKVKLVGAVLNVPYFGQVQQNLTDAILFHTKLKTVAILKKCDYLALYGDESKVPTDPNGILVQAQKRMDNPTQSIKDLRGKRLSPEVISESCTCIADHHGDAQNIVGWMSNGAFEDYTNELIANKQFRAGSDELRAVVASADKFELASGKGVINRDVFMKHRGESYIGGPKHPRLNKMGGFQASNQYAPPRLDDNTCKITVIDDNSGNNYIEAGEYDYAIVPVNMYGTAPAFEVKSITLATGKVAKFDIIDNGAAPGYESTKYDVYRKLHSLTGLTDYVYLRSFAAAQADKLDDGYWIPGTTIAFFMENNPDQVWRIDPLQELVKFELGAVADAYRALLKTYWTGKCFNGNRVRIIHNVGSEPNN